VAISSDGQSMPASGGRAPRAMRRRSRWMTVGAAAGALALALSACGSSSPSSTSKTKSTSSSTSTSKTSTSKTSTSTSTSIKGLYGTVPPVGTPKSGGTITIATLKGSTPTYAMPITPGADSSVYTSYDFIDLMNQPLYWAPKGATEEIDQALSLAVFFENG